jgi:hypothetical protein
MSDHDASLNSLRSSIAANTRWALEPDRSAATAPGRTAFMRRFEDQVDPDRRLDPEERARRVANAKKAYFAALALKSAKARRKVTDGVREVQEIADVVAGIENVA